MKAIPVVMPTLTEARDAAARHGRYLREAAGYERGLVDVPCANPVAWSGGALGVSTFRACADRPSAIVEVFVPIAMLRSV